MMSKPRFLVMILTIVLVSFAFIMSNNMQDSTSVTQYKISQANGVLIQSTDIQDQLDLLQFELKALKSENKMSIQLQQELIDMKTDITFIKSQLMSQQAFQKIDNNASSEYSDLTAETSLSEDLKESQQKKKAFITKIQNSFNEEIIDNNWSVEMTAVLNMAFTNMDTPGASLSHIECRATLCRVDFIYDNQQSLARMHSNIPVEVIKYLPSINFNYEKFSDDKIGVSMYMAKK